MLDFVYLIYKVLKYTVLQVLTFCFTVQNTVTETWFVFFN